MAAVFATAVQVPGYGSLDVIIQVMDIGTTTDGIIIASVIAIKAGAIAEAMIARTGQDGLAQVQ